jgi:hypothetical protein
MENHLGNINWIRNKHGVTMTAERMKNVRGQNYEECVQEGTVIAGSPKTVLAAIEKQHKEIGFNYLLTYLFLGTMTAETAMRSLKLFTSEGDAGGRADVTGSNIVRAKRERIQPDKLHVRKDGDKVLYSQVMVVEVGGTRQIFVAGQTAARPRRQLRRPGRHAGPDRAGRREHQGCAGGRGATLADIVQDHDLRHRHGRIFQAPGHAHALFRRRAADQHHRSGARLSRPEFMVEIEAFCDRMITPRHARASRDVPGVTEAAAGLPLVGLDVFDRPPNDSAWQDVARSPRC